MNTLEKIEWINKIKVTLVDVFGDDVVDQKLVELWDMINEEEKEYDDTKKASMTDEEYAFVNKAFTNSNPIK